MLIITEGIKDTVGLKKAGGIWESLECERESGCEWVDGESASRGGDAAFTVGAQSCWDLT